MILMILFITTHIPSVRSDQWTPTLFGEREKNFPL